MVYSENDDIDTVLGIKSKDTNSNVRNTVRAQENSPPQNNNLNNTVYDPLSPGEARRVMFKPRHYAKLLLEYRIIQASYIPEQYIDKIKELLASIGYSLSTFEKTAHFKCSDERYYIVKESERYEGIPIDKVPANIRQKIITMGTQLTELQVRYAFDAIRLIASRAPFGVVSAAELIDLPDKTKISKREANFVLKILTDSNYLVYSEGISERNQRIPSHFITRFRSIFNGQVSRKILPYMVLGQSHYSLGDRSIEELGDMIINAYLDAPSVVRPQSPQTTDLVPGHKEDTQTTHAGKKRPKPTEDDDEIVLSDISDISPGTGQSNTKNTGNSIPTSPTQPQSTQSDRQPEDLTCCICMENVYCGFQCDHCPMVYHVKCFRDVSNRNCINCKNQFSDAFLSIVDIVTKSFSLD